MNQAEQTGTALGWLRDAMHKPPRPPRAKLSDGDRRVLAEAAEQHQEAVERVRSRLMGVPGFAKEYRFKARAAFEVLRHVANSHRIRQLMLRMGVLVTRWFGDAIGRTREI